MGSAAAAAVVVEDIPSKGIWDPSMNSSSASSLAEDSYTNSDTEHSGSNHDNNPLAINVEGTPSSAMENELRMKIYEDANVGDEDEKGLSAMLLGSIHKTHGSRENKDADAAAAAPDESNPSNPAKQLRDDRKKFILESLSHLSDKQLRTQLFDSFRLARVILGKPIRSKKCKLSHNSILHAIRKVAEMKIQILNMSEELEKYRRKEKKRRSQLKEQGGQEANNTTPTKTTISTPESKSKSNMRQQAIELLQQESDLALDQLQELGDEEQQLVTPTKSTGNSPPASLFLSQSYDDTTDDDSFQLSSSSPTAINEDSAAEILYAFHGTTTPTKEASPTLAVAASQQHQETIQSVLQNVMALKDHDRATTAVHQEVISLLAQLAQEETPVKKKASVPDGTPTKATTTTTPNPDKELEFLELQKELLKEDIEVAKENTTPNRTKLQLERLEDYQQKAMSLLTVEQVRAQQIADLETQLSEMAVLCVKLEDSESEFRHKHEHHLQRLCDFGAQTQIHNERFTELLHNIRNGIRQQRTKVFGVEDNDDEPEPLPTADVADDDTQTIQKLEYLLAKRDAELFNAKAKIKLLERRRKKR